MTSMLAFLLCCITGVQMGRVPKIYNALIASDDNLSPSQAYPVIEPVLQTSAFGVAFPPLLVRPVYRRLMSRPENQEIATSGGEHGQQSKGAQLQFEGTLYPLAYDPYLPYGYRHDLLYPVLPSFYQQPVFVDVAHYAANNHNNNKEAASKENATVVAGVQNGQQEEQVQPLPPPAPTRPAIHFQTHPDIPDVIPPLPQHADHVRNT